MTWSVRITDGDGNMPANVWRACDACKHGQLSSEGVRRVPCNIPAIGGQVGQLLTCIDIGADGYMAGGNAVLKCYGFDPIVN